MKSINHKTIHQRNPIDQSCDTKNWMNLLISIKVDNTNSRGSFSCFFFFIIIIITRANGRNVYFRWRKNSKSGKNAKREKKKGKEKNVKTKERKERTKSKLSIKLSFRRFVTCFVSILFRIICPFKSSTMRLREVLKIIIQTGVFQIFFDSRLSKYSSVKTLCFQILSSNKILINEFRVIKSRNQYSKVEILRMMTFDLCVYNLKEETIKIAS